MAGPMKPGPLSRWVLCLLIFIIASAAARLPAQVEASAPTYIEFYSSADLVSENRSVRIEVPGINGDASFGAFGVVNFKFREKPALDSPVLGEVGGTIAVMMDGSNVLDFYHLYDTPDYKGTLVGKVRGPAGFGDSVGAITGGTEDFLWARGIIELTLVNGNDTSNLLFKTVLHLRYD